MRRFNRFYTRQIGLLDEGLLNSPFSLTQVRTLYELAQGEQTTAVELCQNLGLDAGYLSRILAGFEKSGLIAKEDSPQDGRQTLLRLTKKGHKVFEPLNARSNEQVNGLIGKLAPAKQVDLIRAMGTIESVLSGGSERPASYLLRQHRPGDMGWVVHRHGCCTGRSTGTTSVSRRWWRESRRSLSKNSIPSGSAAGSPKKMGRTPELCFLVKKSATVAKLRLLLVEPSARGLGIGKRLVQECVRFGREAGYKKIMLWTQSELTAARRIYQNAGFKLIAEEKHESWGRKDLVAETWELKL